ncbi:glycosyltransferase family 2 protein [Cobetia sp. L2A1]|uniref:glycosyltransferase family 2 protein n=1 Tax=Cobetia sp. L2A1 TaxID=2686360 RepID=UPI00131C7419|nr:glycosyltransferase family 2 protein [Cobetia sp. L2A1]
MNAENCLVVVPTYNGLKDLQRLIDSLPSNAHFFVIDSSSSDGTADYLTEHEVDHLVIPTSEFNHGGTRQRALVERPGYEIYIFMTQDAYLAEPEAIEYLIQPFEDPMVGAVCGKQLPHLEARPLGRHARLFNYPVGSRTKTMADASVLGIKAAFMSNSFAAYRSESLMSVGGFPGHVILGEDMYVAARMLMAGWKVAYQGSARCHHSHDYTLLEEGKRYFDIGVFLSRENWIQESFGSAGGEGMRFVVSELKFLAQHGKFYIPDALVRNGIKMLGFKLGKQERRLPIKWKRKLSMHRRFWNSSP